MKRNSCRGRRRPRGDPHARRRAARREPPTPKARSPSPCPAGASPPRPSSRSLADALPRGQPGRHRRAQGVRRRRLRHPDHRRPRRGQRPRHHHAEEPQELLHRTSDGGQLLDVSDVELPDGIGGADSVPGRRQAVRGAVPPGLVGAVLQQGTVRRGRRGLPRRLVDLGRLRRRRQAAHRADDRRAAFGTYQHSWQSTVQGFAHAQTGRRHCSSGDFGYLKPTTSGALACRIAGAQVDFATSTTNNLTYQGSSASSRPR